MPALSDRVVEISTSWTRDVAATLSWHASTHFGTGLVVAPLVDCIEALPPAHRLHRALAADDAAADRAFAELATSHPAVMTTFGDPASWLTNVRQSLAPGRPRPVVRQALCALRDRLIPAAEHALTLQQQVRTPLALARDRQQRLAPYGYAARANQHLVALLVALGALASDPKFARYDFSAPTAPRRSGRRDAASVSAFLLVHVVVPTYVAYARSLMRGVGAALLGALVGGALYARVNRPAQPQPQPHAPRADALPPPPRAAGATYGATSTAALEAAAREARLASSM